MEKPAKVVGELSTWDHKPDPSQINMGDFIPGVFSFPVPHVYTLDTTVQGIEAR